MKHHLHKTSWHESVLLRPTAAIQWDTLRAISSDVLVSLEAYSAAAVDGITGEVSQAVVSSTLADRVTVRSEEIDSTCHSE